MIYGEPYVALTHIAVFPQEVQLFSVCKPRIWRFITDGN